MKYLLSITCSIFLLSSCQNEPTASADYGNTAAEGFNAALSDEYGKYYFRAMKLTEIGAPEHLSKELFIKF